MSESVRILAIESSCDETSAAVVADGRRVVSNVVASQIDLHARYGGVVPEIASRAHIEAINTVIGRALDAASLAGPDLDAVAVTHEPGLIGSLLIGVTAAKTLAWVYDRPLVAVNHIYAHAYAAALDDEPIEYPAAALICSGGHTALYHCRSPIDMTLLGSTIDDAAGEAYDKVASVLGLPYPGGPAIDRAAQRGNPDAVRLPRTLLEGQSLDFSFSGLKTAVLYHVMGTPGGRRRESGKPRRRRTATPQRPPDKRGIENFTPAEIDDLCASFQSVVVDVLRIKLRRAAQATDARTLVLGGGVAANSALRAAASELAADLGCTLRMPPMAYCLDNAAMIGGLAWHYFQAGLTTDLTLEARATVWR